MAIREGSGRFGLWPVSVAWDGTSIHRVWFGGSGGTDPIPQEITGYLAGRRTDLSHFSSPAEEGDGVSARIYRIVREIPYGETRTYGEVAASAGTHARVVGGALSRNPTPIIIPCHRVVGKKDIGGFTPERAIKRELLDLEARAVRKGSLNSRQS
ncbi:methylated-DNA-[protein]-cysteine S-methyltransferase [Methanocalculus alkaliphilus]|uniref:methylated-DNA--[protein]-cysteine S-methyltransferase n=1 Tax=Methanocalculus alkaliphilus TaxID=768730 RepID=UPI00209DCC09|nr:MGMT family protein [Methanocalculus alkaliphilus]MCP1714709.1 methylated-DNA-[protein]-cysteine S-methyltransferase [Methanocalculus alkaliphilus]